jgi:FMN phosphatase YigB (HAD superfamily)
VKPDPKIFEIVLEELKSKPNETLFIDDNFEYVTAAGDLGITGIHFQNADQLTSRLIKLLPDLDII